MRFKREMMSLTCFKPSRGFSTYLWYIPTFAMAPTFNSHSSSCCPSIWSSHIHCYALVGHVKAAPASDCACPLFFQSERPLCSATAGVLTPSILSQLYIENLHLWFLIYFSLQQLKSNNITRSLVFAMTKATYNRRGLFGPAVPQDRINAVGRKPM